MIVHHMIVMLLLAAASSMGTAQEADTPRRPAGELLEPAVDTSAPVKNDEPEKPARPVDPSSRSGKAMDRLELEATQITGNRELPKVLYIVPWKRADLGDLLGRPVNSLLDEVLAPVDRDVFKRENRYYRALAPDGVAEAPAPGAAPAGPEK